MKKYLTIFSILITSSVFGDNENYDGKDVSGLRYYESMNDSSWIGATAIKTNFSCSLKNANFSAANLSNSYFAGNFENAIFNDAIISAVTFSDCFLSKKQLYSTANYKNGDLSSLFIYSSVAQMYIDISGYDFSNKNMNSFKSYWIKADFVNFSNSDLTNAGFSISSNSLDIFKNCNFISSILVSALLYANFSGSDFTNANLSGAYFLERTNFTGAVIKGADLTSTVENGFTFAHLQSTKSYATDKDLSGVLFDYNDISGWDFTGQSLQNASFWASKVANVNFTNADLRGADTSIMKGTPIYKNTIMSDGVIKNVSLSSSSDKLTVRKYTPATSGGADISAKISEADVVVSGGATIDFKLGAKLEVTNGKSLTIEDGTINVETDVNSSTLMTIDNDAGFFVSDDTVLNVNVIGEVGDSHTITVLTWNENARIGEALHYTVDNTHVFLSINGVQQLDNWMSKIENNSFIIVFTNVPEPAEWAMILGALALGLAVYRKRK